MTKRKRAYEAVKTTLIILLIFSALFLSDEAGFFRNFFPGFSLTSGIEALFDSVRGERILPLFDESSASTRRGEASKPVFISVTGSGGGHYGVKYSSAESFSIYDDTGNILGEALGSAGTPFEISKTEWQNALKSPGIFYDYLNPVPLSALSFWLVSDVSDGVTGRSVRRICISCGEEDNVSLFFIDEATGRFYKSKTAADCASVTGYLDKYLPNGARFAFELMPLYKGLDPYSIILSETPLSAVYRADNPVSSLISLDDIVLSFGISPYSESHYTETDGTEVYIETYGSLRIGPGGRVVYKGFNTINEKLAIDDTDISSILEGARSFVSSTIGSCSGEAEIYLTDLSISGQEYSLTFGYYVNSTPVYLYDTGFAANLTVENGCITGASLNFRVYFKSDEVTCILPEEQAAAIVSGGELLLSYVDTGAELVEARWTER